MIPSFLLQILADPISKRSLRFDEQKGKLLEETSGKAYLVKKNVPLLIAAATESEKNTTALHEQYNSSFSYIEHYNKDAEFFNYFDKEPKIVAEERKRNRAFIQSKIPKDANLILDIGCGSAWVAKTFTVEKKYVVSLDVSETNPVKAYETYNNAYHAAVVADAKHLPFKNDSFDTIVAAEIIEHLTVPKIFIAEWLRVLKPGGSLIIETPFNEKIVYHLCVHCNCPTPANAHLHSFNKESIQSHLPDVKFTTSTFIFNNKWMNKLRLNYLLQWLPFSIWLKLDIVANSLTGKAESFIIKIVKDKRL
jgi:ubiquinone/menaquinone biosynthesis C-methylase UbiE/uncharacterized protein YbaR (Trm112 family)